MQTQLFSHHHLLVAIIMLSCMYVCCECVHCVCVCVCIRLVFVPRCTSTFGRGSSGLGTRLVCVHVCMCVQVHVYVCMCVFMYVCMRMYMCVCSYKRIYMYTTSPPLGYEAFPHLPSMVLGCLVKRWGLTLNRFPSTNKVTFSPKLPPAVALERWPP